MADLLGLAVEKVNENRLYRALDELLPHKEAVEQHSRARPVPLARAAGEGAADA